MTNIADLALCWSLSDHSLKNCNSNKNTQNQKLLILKAELKLCWKGRKIVSTRSQQAQAAHFRFIKKKKTTKHLLWCSEKPEQGISGCSAVHTALSECKPVPWGNSHLTQDIASNEISLNIAMEQEKMFSLFTF